MDKKLSATKIIGQRIKELRLDKGLTQKQLGELVGRDDVTIHHWENDAHGITLGKLIELSDALYVSVFDILCITEKDIPPNLLDLIRELNNAQQKCTDTTNFYKNFFVNSLHLSRSVLEKECIELPEPTQGVSEDDAHEVLATIIDNFVKSKGRIADLIQLLIQKQKE